MQNKLFFEFLRNIGRDFARTSIHVKIIYFEELERLAKEKDEDVDSVLLRERELKDLEKDQVTYFSSTSG